MKVRDGKLVLTLGALALLNSCGGGGGSPAGPSGVPQGGPSITLSAVPSSGTITVSECAANGVVALCSRDVRGTLTVRYGQSVSEAAVFLEFYTASAVRCAVAITERRPLSANSSTNFSFDIVFFSLPPDYPQFCPLPNTATRIVAYLLDGSDQRLYTQDLQVSYSLVAPTASAPTPTPAPSATPTPASTPRPSPTATPTPAPNPSGFPACVGAPGSASCGRVTGRCNNGQYTCSTNRSGTCSSNGGLACVVCPGPLCQ